MDNQFITTRCPTCGTTYHSGARYCPRDGALLVAPTSRPPASSSYGVDRAAVPEAPQVDSARGSRLFSAPGPRASGLAVSSRTPQKLPTPLAHLGDSDLRSLRQIAAGKPLLAAPVRPAAQEQIGAPSARSISPVQLLLALILASFGVLAVASILLLALLPPAVESVSPEPLPAAQPAEVDETPGAAQTESTAEPAADPSEPAPAPAQQPPVPPSTPPRVAAPAGAKGAPAHEPGRTARARQQRATAERTANRRGARVNRENPEERIKRLKEERKAREKAAKRAKQGADDF